jgi:hypothetical protein
LSRGIKIRLNAYELRDIDIMAGRIVVKTESFKEKTCETSISQVFSCHAELFLEGHGHDHWGLFSGSPHRVI